MVTACVNVMLTPWVGVGITSPVRKRGREFFKQTLHILMYRIRDFLCRWNGNIRVNNRRNAGQRRFGGGLDRHSTSKQYLASLWSNSDSELSQDINAQNGTCHCSLQNFGCKKLALKLDGFGNETPRGDWSAICTLKQGARWTSIGHAGSNVHQVPIIRQLVR